MVNFIFLGVGIQHVILHKIHIILLTFKKKLLWFKLENFFSFQQKKNIYTDFCFSVN